MCIGYVHGFSWSEDRGEDPRMKLTLADMALEEVPAKAAAKEEMG